MQSSETTVSYVFSAMSLQAERLLKIPSLCNCGLKSAASEGSRLNNAAMSTPRLIDRICCMVRLPVQSITGQAEERYQVYAKAHKYWSAAVATGCIRS